MTAALPPRTARRPGPIGSPLQGRHPESWLYAVAGVGWLVLGAHVLHGWIVGAGHGGHATPGEHGAWWLAMVAVMAPLIAANVRYAALRSPRRARRGVTIDVVAGWLGVWVGATVVLGLGAWTVARAAGGAPAVGLLTVIAVGWQHASVKRRSLARCHAVLAPPLDGPRSRRACRRYGLGLGRQCVLSCWPLMALMAVTAHNPLVVASSVGVAWYERRRRPHHDPATRATSVVIALTGAAAVATALLS